MNGILTRIHERLSSGPPLALDAGSTGVWSPLLTSMPSVLRIIVCAGVLFMMQWPTRPASRLDLIPTVLAAHVANQGDWAAIYPGAELDRESGAAYHGARVKAAAAHGLSTDGVGPYMYHPYYLSAFRPLVDHYTIEKLSKYLVRANILAAAWVAFEIACLLGVSGLASQLLITIAVGTSSPLTSGLDFGQNTMVALALAMTALRLWSKGRGTISLTVGALLAALAWSCKPWCALLTLVCLLFRAPLAAALTVSAVTGVMTVLPLVLYPSAMMKRYALFASEMVRYTVPGWHNLSVLISLERIEKPSWLDGYHYYGPADVSSNIRHTALAIAVVVLSAAVLAIIVRRPNAAWVSAAVLGLILVPLAITWTHYFVFAFPIAILGSAAAHRSHVLRVAALGLLAQLVLLEYWLGAEFERESPWPMALPIASVAVVSLLGLWFGSGSKRSRIVEAQASGTATVAVAAR